MSPWNIYYTTQYMHYHENRCHHTNTDRRTIYVYIGLYMDDHILTTVTHLQTFLMPPELGETVSWASMKFKAACRRVIKNGKIPSGFKLHIQIEEIPTIIHKPQ